jgi:uncharacterized membrane protein YhiD involved in acid resistance
MRRWCALWATAAVGVAVALGSYDVSVVISAATFLTLRLPKRKLLGEEGSSAAAVGIAKK